MAMDMPGCIVDLVKEQVKQLRDPRQSEHVLTSALIDSSINPIDAMPLTGSGSAQVRCRTCSSPVKASKTRIKT